MKISIHTSTFAEHNREPLLKLEKAKMEYVLNPFKRTLKVNEVIELARESVGIVAGTEPLHADVLRQLPKLKVISRCGVGLENVDGEYARKHGIKVFATPQGPTDAVAELTVGFMLNLVRQISRMDRNLRKGVWKKEMGNLLCGKKIGIIGFGRIGQKVADLLRNFCVEIFYYDVQRVKPPDNVKPLSLKNLLKSVDIVTLHLSGSQNSPLIGAKEIQSLKRGAWLINVARGGVVDETALYEALKSGKLKGAALDVFSQEPYEGPLKALDNVILTPHIGSYAREARIQMEFEAVENLMKGLKK